MYKFYFLIVRGTMFIVSPFSAFREVLIRRLSKKVQAKRKTKMQVNFPSRDQIAKLKGVVDKTEARLRGGTILDDYNAVVEGTKAATETGLRVWDASLTVAQSGNVMTQIMLGGSTLAESITEFRKGHYFCCVCGCIACSYFWVGAIAGYVPGGYGVWKVATSAGMVTKGVTYTCRKITGGL